MICELGTMLHCSMYGSYHQPIIIHQRNVLFDIERDGSVTDKYFKRIYDIEPERAGRIGSIVTFCDMWYGNWEKHVWVDNRYIIGTVEYNE